MIITPIFDILKMGGEGLGFKKLVRSAASKVKEDFNRQMREQEEKKQYEKERLDQLKKDKIPYCPKCHSTNITFVRKRFSLGRTIVGGAIGSVINPIAGGAGAVLGGLSGKKGKVKCLNCGKEWKL